MKFILSLLLSCAFLTAWCQKKPLDHSVYDGWQSIGEKILSSDGRSVVYTVIPQEGDGNLIIDQPSTGRKLQIARGYHAVITPDGRYVIGRIKPFFKDIREAKIKKKKADEMPRDSLFLVDLMEWTTKRIGNIKSYKVPEKSNGWVAWLCEKPQPETGSKKQPADSLTQLNSLTRMADSLNRMADSLRNRVAEAKTKGIQVLKGVEKKRGGAGGDKDFEEGTELVLKNLGSGAETRFARIKDYVFGQQGNVLVIEASRKKDDTLSKAFIGWVRLGGKEAITSGSIGSASTGMDKHLAVMDGGAGSVPMIADTVIRGFNEARNLALDETGSQLAFVLERDSAAKALRKFYGCYYFRPGMDSARLIVGRRTLADQPDAVVSGDYELNFSKSGQRLFLGLAPLRPIKDTTVPDFEKAGLDVWNYKDDQLQPVQLKNLEKDLKKSWLGSWDIGAGRLTVYSNDKFPVTLVTAEGDGAVFYSSTDSGKRIEQQWQGFTLKDVYAVDASTGRRTLIVKDLKGEIYPSYTGRYLLLYDERKKSYFIYNSSNGLFKPAATNIPAPLYDVENDVPDDPNPYGVAGWEKDDKNVYVYSRYNIWKLDPETGKAAARPLVYLPTSPPVSYRYVRTDPDEKYIDPARPIYLRWFNDSTKNSGYLRLNSWGPLMAPSPLVGGGEFGFNGLVKADSADAFIYTSENYNQSPDIWLLSQAADSIQRIGKKQETGWHVTIGPAGMQISQLNVQQSGYNWGSAELVRWKAYTGRMTEGILYKPEGFDAGKKYPMIVYYYERNNNTLYNYLPPAPTPSRLNIPFFVSRGYLVFVPDIWYTTGHPGKSAYDYIISGVRALVRKGFVDSTKMGLQGQSWGGYQTAYLITKTNMFAAAWAGAPVVNMFSAYGGIRWESGVNRQMQYEKTQSRIGATIWDRPDLYIENSPLFHLQSVKTPLVIMSNDADGAVPWYQGIEFFTAMRRLNKPIWLLEYNGEAHNLVERRNRKDIQIREQQFFDWLLKGEKAPKWITEGVPATLKGIDYGLSEE